MTGSDVHGETPSWGCVHGRFQPFHDGHLEYVLRAWQRCERLIVGITAADPTAVRKEAESPHRHEPASNPFTYFERLRMIQDTLLAEGLKPQGFAIVPFPVHEPGLVCHYVPEEAVHFVRVYSRWEEEKVRRLRGVGAPGSRSSTPEKRRRSPGPRCAARYARASLGSTSCPAARRRSSAESSPKTLPVS